MAADIRIAKQGAGKIGLPEVALGVLPGTGGTQRFARLVGKAKAIEMMAMGALQTFEEAHAIGLVNHVWGDAELNGRTFPQAIQDYATAVHAAEQGREGGRPHQARRAVRPRIGFLGRPRARARAAAAALRERRCEGRLEGESRETEAELQWPLRPSRSVLGAGTMGHGIAHAAMAAGYDTVLYDVSQAAVDKGKAAIDAVISKSVQLGKLGGGGRRRDAWPAAARHGGRRRGQGRGRGDRGRAGKDRPEAGAVQGRRSRGAGARRVRVEHVGAQHHRDGGGARQPRPDGRHALLQSRSTA